MIPNVSSETDVKSGDDHSFLTSYSLTVGRWLNSVVATQQVVSTEIFSNESLPLPKADVCCASDISSEQFLPGS
jgi:hypothetical protein